MSEKILVPVLGESLNEATVSKWLKNKGDIVNADEAIVELETDKVNLEVPASVSGVLSEINSNEGDTVKVGAVLGIISDSKVNIEKIKPKNIEVQEEVLNIDSIDKNQVDNNEDLNIQTEPLMLNEEEEPLILDEEVKIEEKQSKPVERNINLSPAVRKIITEKNIDINKIKGTGRDGRILKGDLIALMGENPQPNQRKIKYGEEERIKMTRLRQTIAKRLKEAQENAAMLTTFNEVDMSGIISMRKENQEDLKIDTI
jgi:Pyruvate/2-oxoglutarate dehydrogenase complex, dihydrolipoamide acyltransferase (E2) component, and related enzymes